MQRGSKGGNNSGPSSVLRWEAHAPERLRPRQQPRGTATLEQPAAEPLPADEGSTVQPRPPRRSSHPLLAAGLSWLLPGLGQFVLGSRRAALVFIVPALAVLTWFAVQLGQGAAFFAVSLWDDSFLAVFLGILIAFGVWRLLAVGHAMRVGWRGRHWRKLDVAVGLVLVASILAAHGAVAAGAVYWYDRANQINQNDFFSDATPIAQPTASPTASATPARPATPRPQFSFPWAAAPAPTNPYPVSEPTLPPSNNRITFLLVGVDFMSGRSHSLTDSLMVVSLDVKTAKAALISVPRDTSAFQLYWGPWVTYNFKINTLVGSVDSGRLKSPDNGIKTLEKEIGYLVGIPIDYYAAVDIDGFVKLIDGVGGVDVNNKHQINDPPFLVLPEGPAHLNGDLAMRYVRSREHGGSDYLRAQRQQEVMKNVEASIVSPAMVAQLPNLLQLASDNISTDFPLKYAKNFVRVGKIVKVDGCVLGPPYSWHPATDSTGGSWTSRLDLTAVAALSVQYFGKESSYYGQPGVVAAPCRSVQ